MGKIFSGTYMFSTSSKINVKIGSVAYFNEIA